VDGKLNPLVYRLLESKVHLQKRDQRHTNDLAEALSPPSLSANYLAELIVFLHLPEGSQV